MPNRLDGFMVYTAEEKPELLPQLDRLTHDSFPRYSAGDKIIQTHWYSVLEEFKAYQFALYDEDEIVGVGATVPLSWDGSIESFPQGFDELLAPNDRGTPNVLCALVGVVVNQHRGRGISRTVVKAMGQIARKCGVSSLIAPVRPNRKTDYPLISIENYMNWRRSDGTLFDPWMRVHERLGAKILGIMPRASVVRGTVKQWEEWTGMRFMSSGSYVIPGALVPVEICIKKDEGVYIEPNVWMEHRIND